MEDLQQIDLIGPEVVEIRVRGDRKVVWVNVDGVCRFRACQIKELIVEEDDKHDDDLGC